MSDAFEELFLLERRQKGMPDLPYVVLPHPFGGLPDTAIRGKAATAVDRVIAALRPREAE